MGAVMGVGRKGREMNERTCGKYNIILGIFVLCSGVIILSSCAGLFNEEVTTTPGPTAVPLSEASKRSTATMPPVQSPTIGVVDETMMPISNTATPTVSKVKDVTSAPTRVMPPEESIMLPAGFGISIFVQGLNDPRMMALGPGGDLHVAERGAERIVRLPDRDRDGVADTVEILADGLNAPSSLAFYADGSFYVGETTRILRLRDPDGDNVFQIQEAVIDGLPSGGHNTRTVLVSPDGQYLFVSIGSSCNVCIEDDERRATIMRFELDSDGNVRGEGIIYARGLRNAVGITFRPGTDDLWATNNGRDWMGDDQPPETVYHVSQGSDAGWPRCHAARIEDPEFGKPGVCEGVLKPAVEMQAHSAPLGLTFYTGAQFPKAYRGDMFVAFHGSWNRSVPTGYKVVRIPMNRDNPGSVRDFAVGWLRDDGSDWGRPVDVLTGADGSLFVSDDAGGKIYRIFYISE